MTARAARWVWLDHVRDRVRDGNLDSSAGHVALALAVHYMNRRGEAWPSQLELSNATGLSERTVRRALHNLENHGLEKRRGRPAHTQGNVYRIDPEPVTGAGLPDRPNRSQVPVRPQPVTALQRHPVELQRQHLREAQTMAIKPLPVPPVTGAGLRAQVSGRT